MEKIQDLKNDLRIAFEKLSGARQKEICKFYNTRRPCIHLQVKAKIKVEMIINLADRLGYGYGEMGYYIYEEVKDFAEDIPELEKVYSRLLQGYFDLLKEVKEA